MAVVQDARANGPARSQSPGRRLDAARVSIGYLLFTGSAKVAFPYFSIPRSVDNGGIEYGG
jgi:hypothetical protein